MKCQIGDSRNAFPLLACTCANLRRAARAVSRLYSRELLPDGIEITQFTLLMALDQAGEIAQGKLGEILALDSTSLTRTLKLLKDHWWVQVKEGDDRRIRIFRLTKAGREKFQRSLPHWKQAQKRLRQIETDRSCGLDIDRQREFGWFLNRQVARRHTTQNAVDI